MQDQTAARQNENILAHLKRVGSISSVEALEKYGAFRLSARIYELRKMGINIISERRHLSGNRYIAIYKLGPDLQTQKESREKLVSKNQEGTLLSFLKEVEKREAKYKKQVALVKTEVYKDTENVVVIILTFKGGKKSFYVDLTSKLITDHLEETVKNIFDLAVEEIILK